MFTDLQGQGRRLIEGCMELVYFMRGAVSYSEVLDMTPGERDIMGTFISKRLQAEHKNNPHNPNY